MDVGLVQHVHLRLLEWAHPAVRRQHEHADAALVAHRVFGGAARVTRRGAENVEAAALAGENVLEQVADQLHRNILER